MQDRLRLALSNYRRQRRFDCQRYLQAKSTLLNTYFEQNGIRACVVGVSGGVDSAVTLGLLSFAARQPGSPIERIVAALLPIHAEGATNQDTATSRGAEVAAAFNAQSVTIDLSSTLDAARDASLAGSGVRGTAWAAGQLVSYLRTPMLYYQAALLSEQGLPAVVCGTTNRDEGSYIGFFGKASDGMVDIQPISDIHKSEVYQLAALLEISENVRNATPTGDTYAGLCDEEMIGTSYDFLELYAWYLCAEKQETQAWFHSLPEESRLEFEASGVKLELLHQKNKHKYIGDSPAVHFDLYQRAVPNGWRTQENSTRSNPLRSAALAARVGPVDLPSKAVEALAAPPSVELQKQALADLGDSATLLRGVLDSEVCSRLLGNSESWQWVPADLHGRPIRRVGANSSDQTIQVGSYRATAYDEDVAAGLWKRLESVLPSFRTMTELTPTDWNGCLVWRPIGINPMLRFIRYQTRGTIYPHYDAGYDFQDDCRHTLMSVIITLTDPSERPGGNTRILLDPQRALPLDERSFEDWNCLASPRDVLLEIHAGKGDAFVFDHRLLHDASIWQGSGSRIVLRTDVIFERCASHAITWSSFNMSPTPTPVLLQKWARDVTYRKAYEILRTEKAIEQAGYFEDGLETDICIDPRWWTAPFGKILIRLSQLQEGDLNRDLVVLVTTGCFCPIHVGHLEMMEEAKRALERQGKVVLGGYFSPDHDSYVLKKCGNGSLSAAQRLDLCERAVHHSDWLLVDHWAANQVPTDINFTAIVDKVRQQLNYHIRSHRPIEVVYVCGSDNARFALSFVGRGSCVCILRPGSEDVFNETRAHPAIRRNPRITFCPNATPRSASRLIRNGKLDALPEGIGENYLRFRKINDGIQRSADTPLVNFYMRMEGNWAVEHLASLLSVDASQVYRAYEEFCEGLVKTFEKLFDKYHTSRGGPTVRIVLLCLDEQRSLFRVLGEESAILSLDPCLPSSLNIEISRCSEPLGASNRSEYVARPGADPLEVQLDRIPNRSFILFDDDSFTGRTATHVQRLLKTRCKVEKFLTLCNANGPLNAQASLSPPRLDLIDCRDFLCGAREAGLVLRLPDGSLGRAPYVLPYVRPHHRASVPLEAELEFSRRVWELNKKFFASVGSVLRVSDMSPAFQSLCTTVGFGLDTTMEEHCAWHLKHFHP
ncbi:hypothetical protein K469DRAFT_709547 [Zopfia rhizophila CBS 207.26]|uniref:Uncharacterized protein n=1 Tax=Zopfia rhizophila CBS 207.26 TaxID=1314779 RepID=A0A6A6ERX4_9PEZI|nr:hypothetical protein K469DRAFT_709547 [Zopfia rhizophila CBS 207.26]